MQIRFLPKKLQYANFFKVFKFKDFFKIKMKNRVVDGVVEGIRLASSIFNRDVLNFGNFLKSRYFWPKANKKFDIHPAPPHPTPKNQKLTKLLFFASHPTPPLRMKNSKNCHFCGFLTTICK